LDTESTKQILKRVGEELRKAKDEGVDPNWMVQNVEQELLAAEKRLNIDFEHPFYWASFVKQMTQGQTRFLRPRHVHDCNVVS
jgi:CHAT domain-containing protein